MSSSIFSDKSIQPDNRKLAAALGHTYPLWVEIKSHIQAEYGELVEEWKYYSPKSGWILKSLNKKRNLFFFTPCQKYFRISFIFGDKAVAAIEKSDLPAAMIEELRKARKYAEGRGLRLEIRKRSDVEHVKKLLAVKVMN
jgi:hypothetical protein